MSLTKIETSFLFFYLRINNGFLLTLTLFKYILLYLRRFRRNTERFGMNVRKVRKKCNIRILIYQVEQFQPRHTVFHFDK